MKLYGLFGIACGMTLFASTAAFALPKATEIYPKMGLGYNIGNTMEVPGNPTAWGNSFPDAAYVKAIKDAGFTTVRIPCAWDSHASNGTINAGWLDSVKTVVDLVIGNGMYAILNSHWDNGWLEDRVFDGTGYAKDETITSSAAEVAAKQENYWKQIAAKFAAYDLEAARAFFTAFCTRYFKDAYFALAPLLAVPLYQQTRTHENIHGGGAGHASFWEHEAIANFYGEGRFRHPRSATRNILKTRVASREGGFSQLEVTAHGHQIVKRVDVVQVMARNGRYYGVSVPWDEYQPVSRTTPLRIAEREGLSRTGYDEGATLPSDEWRAFFRALGASPSAARPGARARRYSASAFPAR